MKKLFMLIIIFTINVLAFGQFTSLTPKVGITVSNMKDFYRKYKTGYLVGASVEFELNSKVVLRPELLLEQKGGCDKVEFTDENGWSMGQSDVYLTFNNLTLPVQLKFSPFNNNKIYFTAGEYVGYLLWVGERVNSKDGDYRNNRIDMEKKYFTRWELGFSIGSGIDIPLSKKGDIQVDLRYENAFAHFNPRIFTTANTFSLSVGYMINSGK
jgi:opacity protein-like surface antigen